MAELISVDDGSPVTSWDVGLLVAGFAALPYLGDIPPNREATS